MDGSVMGAEALSAALLAMEEQFVTDPAASLAAAARLERQAMALGDEALVMRARLRRVCMSFRTGETAGVAREFYDILHWAARHDERLLEARAHGACADIHQYAGDGARQLEHALSAVQLLDETAPTDLQITLRIRLCDALAATGAMDSARQRYRQTEDQARKEQRWNLLAVVLNNWAYYEYELGNLAQAREVTDRMAAAADAHSIELDPVKLHTIAEIQAASGDYAAAEQSMLTCIARHEAGHVENAADLAFYQLTLARARRGLGDLVQAQQNLDACRELCAERGLQELLAQIHEEQAELHAARGEHTAAFAELKAFTTAKENLASREREAQAQARHAVFETTEARQQADQYREQARRDPLTGLPNRRYADEKLPALITGDPHLTLAIADIDHFKRINDTLSHDTGDQVLIQVAKILETELTAAIPNGFTARLGGEEFLLALPGTPLDVAASILDHIRHTISTHDWHHTTAGLPVTVSIGAAATSETAPPTQAATLASADRNLYAAKHQGRNRVATGTPREHLPRAYRDRDIT
ncbi:diguanylate cyclase (GGDEF)-like protein [Krasilnikovia cinnamomea]|uniref:Diguanylate cyclase (GGDEF)-like protein n=1 Tax=Krasilnikovia cinnamomea TaxID=349313 RepID=A0A4Q7ZD42_9ACTN|nr:GGDEF domain-containing protein [Krasilnikovia cinnamomea]RZU48558.1 diguanylate cyclase (GGDEF)-like protein [Krasilnikovia cinnamomea]